MIIMIFLMKKIVIKYPHERTHFHSLSFDDACDLVRSTPISLDMSYNERFDVLNRRYF